MHVVGLYWPSVYKENVQRLNLLPFTKKGKTMLEYFEVGGGNQMEFSTTPAYVTHDLSNVTPQCVKLWTHIAELVLDEHLWLKVHTFFFF